MAEKSNMRFLRRSEVPVLIATLFLSLIFAVSSENFFSAYNMYNIMRTAAVYVLIALSQAMVMMVGGTSLCIGYIGAMSVVTAGYCMQNLGIGGIEATFLAVLVSMLCGAMNGVIITKLGLSAFVATLSTQFIFKGLVTGISKGFPYTVLSPNYTAFGRGSLLGIPYITLLVIGILMIVWYVFRFTTVGRRLLATGGNEFAAKMAAVKTNQMIFIANILSGVFAGIAAVCTVSMNGSGQPSTGADWMLYSFAVAVIGGTGLKGGVINPVGLAIAGFLIVIIKNGLVLMDANVYFEQTYLGMILLVACSIGVISQRITAAKRRHQFRMEQLTKSKP